MNLWDFISNQIPVVDIANLVATIAIAAFEYIRSRKDKERDEREKQRTQEEKLKEEQRKQEEKLKEEQRKQEEKLKEEQRKQELERKQIETKKYISCLGDTASKLTPIINDIIEKRNKLYEAFCEERLKYLNARNSFGEYMQTHPVASPNTDINIAFDLEINNEKYVLHKNYTDEIKKLSKNFIDIWDADNELMNSFDEVNIIIQKFIKESGKYSSVLDALQVQYLLRVLDKYKYAHSELVRVNCFFKKQLTEIKLTDDQGKIALMYAQVADENTFEMKRVFAAYEESLEIINLLKSSLDSTSDYKEVTKEVANEQH